jgi:hypothetical protein
MGRGRGGDLISHRHYCPGKTKRQDLSYLSWKDEAVGRENGGFVYFAGRSQTPCEKGRSQKPVVEVVLLRHRRRTLKTANGKQYKSASANARFTYRWRLEHWGRSLPDWAHWLR